MTSKTKINDPKGAHALRYLKDETKRAYEGSKSKPLPSKRFDIKQRSGSGVALKGKSRGA